MTSSQVFCTHCDRSYVLIIHSSKLLSIVLWHTNNNRIINWLLKLVYHMKFGRFSPHQFNKMLLTENTKNVQVDIRHHEASFPATLKAAMVDYCCFQWLCFCLDSRSFQTDCTSQQKTAPRRKAGLGIPPAGMTGESRERRSAGRCRFQCTTSARQQLPGAGSDFQTPTMMLCEPSLLPPHSRHDL